MSEPMFTSLDYVKLYEGLYDEIESFLSEFNYFTVNNDPIWKKLVGSIAAIIQKKFSSLTVR